MSIFVDHKALKHLLRKLKDVDIVNPVEWDALIYWDGKWTNMPPVWYVDDLLDVGILNPQDMDMLILTGTPLKWKNQPYTLANLKDALISAPANGEVLTYVTADQKWKNRPPSGGVGTKIQDSDGDTKVDTEESADEDKVRMDVKGVEAFLLDELGILTLAKQSGCCATRPLGFGGYQSIPSGAWTTIQLNTEVFDIQDEFDTSTYRFTAKKAGLYLVVGQLTMLDMGTDAGTEVDVGVFKNGAAAVNITAQANMFIDVPAGADPTFQCMGVLFLAVGDYLLLQAYHNYGADRNCWGYYTKLFVAKIA